MQTLVIVSNVWPNLVYKFSSHKKGQIGENFIQIGYSSKLEIFQNQEFILNRHILHVMFWLITTLLQPGNNFLNKQSIFKWIAVFECCFYKLSVSLFYSQKIESLTTYSRHSREFVNNVVLNV